RKRAQGFEPVGCGYRAGTQMESAPAATRLVDDESREWLSSLRGTGAVREAAIERLHALLLRAARFEVARRRPALPHLRGNEGGEVGGGGAGDAAVGGAPPPRRLPRREPLHDLGLQVRVARGGGQAA